MQKINVFLTTMETVIPKINILLKIMETVIRNCQAKRCAGRMEEQDIWPFQPPAMRKHHCSHAHAASPRPLARTHNKNAKRNRNQFPGWGQQSRLFPPTSDISATVPLGTEA